jgi:hypothetical protein
MKPPLAPMASSFAVNLRCMYCGKESDFSSAVDRHTNLSRNMSASKAHQSSSLDETHSSVPVNVLQWTADRTGIGGDKRTISPSNASALSRPAASTVEVKKLAEPLSADRGTRREVTWELRSTNPLQQPPSRGAGEGDYRLMQAPVATVDVGPPRLPEPFASSSAGKANPMTGEGDAILEWPNEQALILRLSPPPRLPRRSLRHACGSSSQ